jgi:hypothetical protein
VAAECGKHPGKLASWCSECITEGQREADHAAAAKEIADARAEDEEAGR